MAECLEQAGFPQDTAYWWVYRQGEWKVTNSDDLSYNEPAIAAPNEIEILKRLPMRTSIQAFDAEMLAIAYLRLN
jgi:hypothetical protein